MGKIRVRFATREDCKEILRLRDEQAFSQSNKLCKRLGNKPVVSVEDLQRDGFDVAIPYFKCLVAETEEGDSTNCDSSPLIGFLLYYYEFAAFEGKGLRLEELCVAKEYQGTGVDSVLFQSLAKICIEEKLARISLEDLAENSTAVEFYEKHGGFDSTKAFGWVAYCFEGEALSNLAS